MIDGRSRHTRRSGRLAALFLFDLRAILMGPIDVALIAGHFHDPHPRATGATNASGNHDPLSIHRRRRSARATAAR
jgi:hypothetical protein